MSLVNDAAKNCEKSGKYLKNAGKYNVCEKSKATINVIGSCSDGNDRGASKTVRNEGRSGSNAQVTSGKETKREETNNSTVRDSKKNICSTMNNDVDRTSYGATTKVKARTANKL